MNIELRIAGILNYTGYCDITGERIYIGSRLQFRDYSGAIWQGDVVYEDGIITIDILNLEQIENPPNWKQLHDWVKSKHCGCQIGYPEYGTWNHNRKQLIDIAGMFKNYEDYKSVIEKYLEKYDGYAHESLFRPLPCLLIYTPATGRKEELCVTE